MKWLWIALAVVGLAGASVALFMQLVEVRRASIPEAPSLTVPERWQHIRLGHMHAVHLEEGQLACTDCHGDAGFTSPPRSRCEGCHAQQARIEHARGGMGPVADARLNTDAHLGPLRAAAECIACHRFDESAEPTAWECMDCHALPQGDLPATKAHASEACATCHTPHGDTVAKQDRCDQCHAVDNKGLAHGACVDCHSVHGSANLAVEACQACHALPKATFAAGHSQCTQCHAPHAFAKTDVQRCQSCHDQKRTLASLTAPAHRRCESCHAPHDVAGASDQTCRQCHAQTSDHPRTADGAACTSCHPAHPNAAQATNLVRDRRMACTACHRDEGERTPVTAKTAAAKSGARAMDAHHAAKAGPENLHHGGRASCTDCHTPHDFVRESSRESCIGCHRNQDSATQSLAGHSQCQQCHMDHPHDLGHGSARRAASTCTNCHRDLHTDPGHQRSCLGCHDAHAGASNPAACQTCHAAQVGRVRTGHKDCRTCHAPHRRAGEDEAPIPSCVSCHSAARKTPHGTQCRSCHDPHGGSPADAAWPDCSACHQTPRAGMHAFPGHAECSKCHQGAHGNKPPGTRANCIGCHQAQRNHEPKAKECQGCHLFR